MNTETAQHTPLPILKMHDKGPFIGNNDRWYVIVKAADIYNISITGLLDDDADTVVKMANTIIKAVNNHDALVEALKGVIKLRDLIEYPATVKPEHEGEAQAVYAMLSKIESALNKVEQ